MQLDLLEATLVPRQVAAPVVVFDVETTGTDKAKDQIIELCLQFGLDDGPTRTWRFLPAVPIAPGAQRVHGISMADLAECPSFAACAEEIVHLLEQAEVVVGYNLAFDIDMLQAELERCRMRPIDFSQKSIVDAFRLWQQCEPRSLQHAHQRFVGDRFADAHSASADVAATGRVLEGMLRAFGLEGRPWRDIAEVCDPDRKAWFGPSRHLQWQDGVVVVAFGKYAGTPLQMLATSERGYLQWISDKDFPPHVGETCKKALELGPDAFVQWAAARFGSAE